MGAYYAMATEGKKYSTHEVGQGSKLMEHSYVGNPYVEKMLSLLVEKSKNIQWLCDYTVSNDETNQLTWDTAKNTKYDSDTYELNSTYIIFNHTKKVYIDMKEYIYKSTSRMFIIHPLPILVNSETTSMGGGDFHPEDSRRGSWKNDLIEVRYDEVLSEGKIEDYKNVTMEVYFFEDSEDEEIFKIKNNLSNDYEMDTENTCGNCSFWKPHVREGTCSQKVKLSSGKFDYQNTLEIYNCISHQVKTDG